MDCLAVAVENFSVVQRAPRPISCEDFETLPPPDFKTGRRAIAEGDGGIVGGTVLKAVYSLTRRSQRRFSGPHLSKKCNLDLIDGRAL